VTLIIGNRPFTVADAAAWQQPDSEVLVGTAGSQTDLFVDPKTGSATLNAPRLLSPPPAGDFQFSARVEVEFRGTFDAGVLLLWAAPESWAKLCFEFSPQGQPMVVSVVTQGRSDDANAFSVDSRTVWLRISRIDEAYAFHASTDGQWWHLIRQFTLGALPTEVGFEVQSPVGDGCRATYTQISFTDGTLQDLRDGR